MPPLNSQHREAIERLSRGETQLQVATSLNINRRTLGRWLKIRQFADELEAARSGHRSAIVEILQADEKITISDLWALSLKVTADILQDPDARTGDKLKAAQIVTEWMKMEQIAEMRRSQQEQEEKRSLQPNGLSDATAAQIRAKILGLPSTQDPSKN